MQYRVEWIKISVRGRIGGIRMRGRIGWIRMRGRIGWIRMRGRIGRIRMRGRIGRIRMRGRIGWIRIGGRIRWIRIRGRIGWLRMRKVGWVWAPSPVGVQHTNNKLRCLKSLKFVIPALLPFQFIQRQLPRTPPPLSHAFYPPVLFWTHPFTLICAPCCPPFPPLFSCTSSVRFEHKLLIPWIWNCFQIIHQFYTQAVSI